MEENNFFLVLDKECRKDRLFSSRLIPKCVTWRGSQEKK